MSCRDVLYIRYRSDRVRAGGAARGRHGTPDLDLLHAHKHHKDFLVRFAEMPEVRSIEPGGS